MDYGNAIEACSMLVQLGRAIPADKWLSEGKTQPDFSWLANFG